ncbi:MAG: alpha-glucosidase, partial [Acidimicrobiaceae bacterium]
WEGSEPWLPFPPEPGPRSVESLGADEGSILHLYRRLLAARRTSPALSVGELRLLDDLPEGVLGYERTHGDDHRTVLVNFLDAPVPVPLHRDFAVDITSDGGLFDGILAPSQAVLVRAAGGSALPR